MVAQISLGISWSGGAEPPKQKAVSHMARHEVLLLLSISGTTDCKTSNSKAIRALSWLCFCCYVLYNCKRRPRDTNLVLLIRDLYGNTVIQIQNNPGSHPEPNFQIDHFQPTVVLETQNSLPFKRVIFS